MTDTARAGDRGFTLLEVVMAMSIMSIFLAMFSAGIAEIFRMVNSIEASSTAQSGANLTFLRLDKEIRYAASISTPGPAGGDISGDTTYVEYLTTSSGTAMCTELRLQISTGLLQRRAWIQSAPPATIPWTPLASGVTAATSFTLLPPDSASGYQRLGLKIVIGAGAGATAATKEFDATFTGLNTSVTSSSTDCIDGRSIP